MPFKLKLKVAKLDDVPESYRSLYSAEGSEFVLKPDAEIEIPDVSAITANRDAILAEKQALAAKFAGVDVEQYNRLTKEAKARAEAGAAAGDEGALAQMKELHKTEMKTARDREALLLGALGTHVVQNEALKAITARNGNPALLMPLVQQHVKMIEKDGQFSARVMQADGVTPRVNADGQGVGVDVLVSEWEANPLYAGAFKASGAGGSGSQPGASGFNGAVTKVGVAEIGANLEALASGKAVLSSSA